MTRIVRTWIAAGFIAACGLNAAAQEREPAPRSEGDDCWVNDKIVTFFVKKAARDMADTYGCDEYQRMQLEETMVKRVTEFMEKNRDELRPLMNEYLEKAFGDEPPTPQDAAAWASRALPMLDSVGGLVTTMADDMRSFMTPEQVDQLDGQLAAIDAGASFMQQRLLDWNDGHFDVRTEWPGAAEFKAVDRERRRELQTAMENARRETLGESLISAAPGGRDFGGASAGSATGGEPAEGTPRPTPAAAPAPKDEWTIYVEDFCKRYGLNAEQQQQAQMSLRKQLDALDNYLRRKADEMARIEKLFASSKEKGEVERAEAAYQKLMAPKKNMFEVLKKDLERIPTRKQRQDAAAATSASKPR